MNKTLIWGSLLVVQAVVTGAIAFVDNDPATNPDFALIATSVVAALGIIKAGNVRSDDKNG